jgi:hypothetical protein
LKFAVKAVVLEIGLREGKKNVARFNPARVNRKRIDFPFEQSGFYV